MLKVKQGNSADSEG